jgi:hypothetical protein
MAGQSYLGISIFVSPTTPTTNTEAAFEALTWTEAEYLVTGPALGYTHSMIDIPDLKTGKGVGVKGMGQGQDTTMTFRIEGGELATGQIIVKARADHPQGNSSIKMVRGTGTNLAPAAGDPVVYAQGVLHSYTENEATDSNYEGFSVGFRLNAEPIRAEQPTP